MTPNLTGKEILHQHHLHLNSDGGAPSEKSVNAVLDPSDTSMAKCIKCNDEVTITETHSAGRAGVRVCKLCYNATRALSLHFAKRGKKEEWLKMAPAKKRKLIVDNKYSGGIRGKERNIAIREEAGPSPCLSRQFFFELSIVRQIRFVSR